MASGKGANSTKSTNFKLLWGSLHIGYRRSRKSTRALEMASGKGADSTKSTNFGLLWGFLYFGGPRDRKSRKSIGALEMASGKGAGSAKSTTFELLWGSLHFDGPRGQKSRKSTGALEMAAGKDRTLQNRQILGFCGVPSEIQEIHRGVRNDFRKRNAQPSLQLPCRSAKGYFLFCSSLCSLFCSPPCSLQSSRTVWYFKSCRLQSLGFTVVVLQASRLFRGSAREEP